MSEVMEVSNGSLSKNIQLTLVFFKGLPWSYTFSTIYIYIYIYIYINDPPGNAIYNSGIYTNDTHLHRKCDLICGNN